MHNPAMVFLRKPCSADAAKLVLRVGLAFVFIFHGWMKLSGLDGTGMFFEKLGIPLPGAMAVLVACVEFFGGIFVLLGLATRFWAAGHVVIMVVAVLTAKEIGSFKTYEFEFSLMMTALALVLSGAGAYGLDAMLMKKGSVEHDAALPVAKP